MAFVKHILNKESLEQIGLEDIERLIGRKTEESLHLDYEEIPKNNAQFEGLAKHISGFLNTSGGIVLFGVSESKEKGRHVPLRITWSNLEKETVENNIYQRIDPWLEDIQIHPVQDSSDDTQRIFVILAPKSRDQLHMANHIYYTRLNFQTKPLSHEQVSAVFRQYYLQKYDLVHTVYGPLYNELVSYYDETNIREWQISKYEQIRRDRLFLLMQDAELYSKVDDFYRRVTKWNKALNVARFRLASITNSLASTYFEKKMPSTYGQSALSLEIKAESTCQIPSIDAAVLNGEDPLEFWKREYPFDKIIGVEYRLLYEETIGVDKTLVVQKPQFEEFMSRLKDEVAKDDLIRHVREEHERLQSEIEVLLDEFENRM